MSKVYTDQIEKRTGGTAMDVPASGKWDTANIASGAVGATELDVTLDLSAKTVTLPAVSVTAHVTAYDDAGLRNDISTLALHSAIADNKAAYNLSNSFIDQFEDDTGLDVETTTDRHISSEYVGSMTEQVGSPTWITTSRFQTQGDMLSDLSWIYPIQQMSNGNNTQDASNGSYPSPTNQSVVDVNIFTFDFGASFNSVITNFRFTNNGASSSATVYYQGSNDEVTWTTLSGNVANWGSGTGTIEFGDSTLAANTNPYRYIRIKGVSGAVTNAGMWNGLAFKEKTITYSLNASGNYTSASQTAQSTVSTMGAVILYKNNAGTASLNTDLVCQLSADGGSNYTTATLEAGGTFSTGISIAKVNGLTIGTSGTAPKYKISFANQSSGTKETQVHGVALLY